MSEQITVLDAISQPPEWWAAHVVTTAHGQEIVCAMIHTDDFPGHHRIYTSVEKAEYFWEAADALLTVTQRQQPPVAPEFDTGIEMMTVFQDDYDALVAERDTARREIEALRAALAALQNEAMKRAHNIKAFTEALPLNEEEIVAPHVVINSGYQAWLQAHELEGYIETMRKGQPE